MLRYIRFILLIAILAGVGCSSGTVNPGATDAVRVRSGSTKTASSSKGYRSVPVPRPVWSPMSRPFSR